MQTRIERACPRQIGLLTYVRRSTETIFQYVRTYLVVAHCLFQCGGGLAIAQGVENTSQPCQIPQTERLSLAIVLLAFKLKTCLLGRVPRLRMYGLDIRTYYVRKPPQVSCCCTIPGCLPPLRFPFGFPSCLSPGGQSSKRRIAWSTCPHHCGIPIRGRRS